MFPQWVSRALRKLPGDGAFHVHFSEPGISDKFCNIVDITTDKVCATCNHGWMSDLESVVSPIATPALLGNETIFPLRWESMVAMWATKTALMMDCAWGDLGQPRLVPDQHCRDLYQSRNPRNSTYVWTTSIGYDPRTQSFQHGWMGRSVVAMDGLSSGRHFDGYAITWHFGYIGFQVVCFGVDDESFNAASRADLRLPDGQVLPAASFTRQFFPLPGSDIAWPPPLGLEQIGLGVWSQQPPFVHGIRALT